MRRSAVVGTSSVLAAAVVLGLAAPQPSPERVQDPATRAQQLVFEGSIRDLQRAMEEAEVTSVQLVDAYLARIAAYDEAGPRLGAMVFLNPSARDEAAALDAERAERGSRGPLHGIPIVLKDNFDTADMPTTAGSIALAGFVPPDDATQVRRLREAGAVILGKTNLHELARGITTISSLGGQTRNPYDPERNPGGSSGGTGAAVAASLAAVGMGTDTCGSIRIPAAQNNLFGLRGTHGLSSRDGIVPLALSFDIAGPLARTVDDLVVVLDATVGADPADPITAPSAGRIPPTYAADLHPDGLRGARIGVLRELFGDAPEDMEVTSVIEAALEEMRGLGAEVFDVEIAGLDELLRDVYSTIRGEFKFQLADYLEAGGAPVRSLGEILEAGLYHAALERAFRGSERVESLDTPEYRDAMARRDLVRRAVLDLMDRAERELDAVAYPTLRRVAARIGEPQGGSNCQLSVTSGLPAISVPAGFTDEGLPVGLELLGRPFDEPALLRVAYAFEKGTDHRRPPHTTPPLGRDATAGPGWTPPGPVRFEIIATGSRAVPPVDTAATARGRFAFDEATGTLSWEVDIEGLADDEVLFAHLHRGRAGENGPVVLILAPSPFTSGTGSARLDPPLVAALGAGELYLNVHTRQHRRGALRAPLELPPDRR